MPRPPALVPAAVALAWADHPGVAGSNPSTGGLGWLYLAGVIAVVAVGLAVWAMFAPEREDPRDEDG